MKKCILTLALGLFCAVGFAQDYVIVNQGTAEHKYLLKEVTAINHDRETVYIEQGENVYPYALATVDSITFVDSEEHVMPGGFDPLKPFIPIYEGDTPPNIEGCYLVNPNVLTYSTLSSDYEGMTFVDEYEMFYNQDMLNNTIDYKDKTQFHENVATESFITGEGDNFTVFFNIDGIMHASTGDVSYKQVRIISGTWTSTGIKNLYWGFMMIEKSYDPNNVVVEVGTIRVGKDGNGFSDKTSWPSWTKLNQKTADDALDPSGNMK